MQVESEQREIIRQNKRAKELDARLNILEAKIDKIITALNTLKKKMDS